MEQQPQPPASISSEEWLGYASGRNVNYNKALEMASRLTDAGLHGLNSRPIVIDYKAFLALKRERWLRAHPEDRQHPLP